MKSTSNSQGVLYGKVVLVTGAAQGIGREVAVIAAREGADLVLVDRSEKITDVLAELQTQQAMTFQADLETWEGAKAVTDFALGTFDRIDVCINAVGGTIWARPYEHYDPQKIQAEITRSLFPTLWMTRAVLPAMKARRSGTIVNVSSIATRGVNRVPYSAAKGGVNALTASLAQEVAADGIRVVATAPGGTEAPARQIPRGPGPQDAEEKQWFQEVVDQTVNSSLMKRYGTLREQAEPIVFLASDAASYITGSVLPIGGGDQGL